MIAASGAVAATFLGGTETLFELRRGIGRAASAFSVPAVGFTALLSAMRVSRQPGAHAGPA